MSPCPGIATLTHRDVRGLRPRHVNALNLPTARYRDVVSDLGGGSLDPVQLRTELERVQAENTRLRRVLRLRPGEEAAPGPTQTGMFDAMPGAVDNDSPSEKKVAFYRALFAGRIDVYAVRWENNRTGRSGWMPAVRGGWRKGVDRRDYLPLSDEVVRRHLTGELEIGLYPLLDGDR